MWFNYNVAIDFIGMFFVLVPASDAYAFDSTKLNMVRLVVGERTTHGSRFSLTNIISSTPFSHTPDHHAPHCAALFHCIHVARRRLCVVGFQLWHHVCVRQQQRRALVGCIPNHMVRRVSVCTAFGGAPPSKLHIYRFLLLVCPHSPIRIRRSPCGLALLAVPGFSTCFTWYSSTCTCCGCARFAKRPSMVRTAIILHCTVH